MNILMVTNTFSPHVGGVAHSVERFAAQYRKRGHRVLVLAPSFEGQLEEEEDVVRIPAIQHFNGSDFSVRLPIPASLFPKLTSFAPDIVHSHHPFLLGDTAVRIAALNQVPLVFTHHTKYEEYTHYVPGDSPELKDFVVELATGYANLCNAVVAPSSDIKSMLIERGVESDIQVICTGVDTKEFKNLDEVEHFQTDALPDDALVIGHVGRLAPEKNLSFLTHAIIDVVKKNPKVFFLVVGDGPSKDEIEKVFQEAKLEDNLLLVGRKKGKELVSCYSRMDLFVFSSYSETQGMVLLEAMACGVPIVALDAPGVRDVVQTGYNGHLVKVQNKNEFVTAIEKYFQLSSTEKSEWIANARATAEKFSIGATADLTLNLYSSLLNGRPIQDDIEESSWANTLHRIACEWELLENRTTSAEKALFRSRLSKYLSLPKLVTAAGWLRLKLSRAEWTIRLLQLWKSANTESSPGIILVQIDGLSHPDFRVAVQQGKLRFLRHLLKKEAYEEHSLFSGVPSTTATVQGELFYGLRQIVPSFSFYDLSKEKYFRMFEPSSASHIESTESGSDIPLLKGGSCYSNIYSGGAREVHFSSSAFGWGSLLTAVNPWALLGIAIWHGWSVVRTIVLMCVETLLAFGDFLQGVISGKNLWKEMLFVPSRVAICIWLREMVIAGAVIDAFRGLPIIHLNLLGYDEQAHRRGPKSQFAYWTLKGIDNAIKRVWHAALSSPRRDYIVWIYSDHGQESTIPYQRKYNRTVQQAIAEVFGKARSANGESERYKHSSELRRASWLGGTILQKLLRQPTEDSLNSKFPIVTADGPIGHVYSGERLSDQRKSDLASQLVKDAKIPLVLYQAKQDVFAVTKNGTFVLPTEAENVLGINHPFLKPAAQDLKNLVQHKFSGDFVISGWSKDEPPIAFPVENGSHGGPGSRETHAFVLVPRNTKFTNSQNDPIRPIDLRDAALRHLKLLPKLEVTKSEQEKKVIASRLRVVTYNVHSCIGMDGKISHSRISRLMSQLDPDIIALQELDLGRRATQHLDQAHAIARELRMDFQFFPVLHVEGEKYGDAILSRFPMTLEKAESLPGSNGAREPRGALWVSIDIDGHAMNFFNTHFGLYKDERLAQVEALLSSGWLNSESLRGPVILCGDFNASPSSIVYKKLQERLSDVYTLTPNPRRAMTWSSRYPIRRIDYVFVSEHLKVLDSFVVRNELSRRASDHLPLVVDLELDRNHQ